MKLLYVVESLSVGGAEKVAVMLANLFHKNGHEVTVLVICESYALECELDKDIKIYRLKRKSKFNVFKMVEFYQMAEKFDLIHCHMMGAYRYAALIKKTFRLPQPLIFHDHNGDVDLEIKVNFSLKYIFRPQFYIAVCNPLLQWAIKELNISPNNAYVLKNTVPKVNYDDADLKNDKIILVANFRSTKNIEFAVELAGKINLHIDVYGKINDRMYYESIKNLSMKLGVEKKINFITDSNNVRAKLNEYSLAIHTAKSESGPLVLLEYLNAGLPFVTYRTGEVVTQLANRFPEMIMNNFSVDDWVMKINYLIENQSGGLRHELRAVFENEFSGQAYYQNCLEIYKKILNDFPNPS